MLGEKSGGRLLGVFAILILAGPAAAQMIDVGKFKKVEIPYTLRFKDKVLEKGQYDLETVKNQNTPSCYLRFKKNNEVICLVEGERLTVPVRAGARLTDPNIPDTPRLKMKKDREEKVLIFTVETGRRSRYPFLLLRFKLEYEE
jgi:hypothetical protein